MNQMDDHWLRPRTKAGTEEMRKRLKVMRSMLEQAASQDFSSLESKIASKVFNEYFSFEWEDVPSLEEKKVDLEKKKVALPDRC